MNYLGLCTIKQLHLVYNSGSQRQSFRVVIAHFLIIVVNQSLTSEKSAPQLYHVRKYSPTTVLVYPEATLITKITRACRNYAVRNWYDYSMTNCRSLYIDPDHKKKFFTSRKLDGIKPILV